MNLSFLWKIVFIIILLTFSNLPAYSSTAESDSLNLILSETENDSIRIYTLIELSRIESKSNITRSIQLAKRALNLAEQHGTPKYICYAMHNVGNAYFLQGLLSEATIYYYRFYDIKKKENDSIGMALALSNIGGIKIYTKDYYEAKECILKALRINKKGYELEENPKYDYMRVYNLNNVGISYQNLHKYDSALYYYQKGLSESLENQEYNYIKGNLLNNLGSLSLELNELDQAYEYIIQAQEIRKQENNQHSLIASNNMLSEYYILKGKTKKAIELYNISLTMTENIGSYVLGAEICKNLYELYFQQNNADSALKYVVLLHQYKDSINMEETKISMTQLELKMGFEEKERIKELELERQNIKYLFIISSFIILLLVFILLYFLSRNRMRRLTLEKNNFELSAQNTNLMNITLEKELEVRNKELTTHVMSLVRKNELIKHIKKLIINEQANINTPNYDFINSILKDLTSIQDESIWVEFEMRYQKVHQGFYDKLQNKYPDLSTNERRLCAFLRLNMTTKDIASITGQSTRSIEVARTRLRKKIQITNSDISLVEFLSSL